MKRNMLAVVILAATLINLSLSAVLIFTVIPKAKRTDALIEKIVAAVDLETESGIGKNYGEVALGDQHEFKFETERDFNLKPSGNKSGIARGTISLTLNKKHDDYTAIEKTIQDKESKIVSEVRKILSGYTSTEVPSYMEDIHKDVLEAVQGVFGSECIIEVILDIVIYDI